MTNNNPVSPEGREAARQLRNAANTLLKLKAPAHRPQLLDLFNTAIVAVEAEYPGATSCTVDSRDDNADPRAAR